MQLKRALAFLFLVFPVAGFAANALNWEAEITAPSNVLTTELNALADAEISDPSSAQDNGTALDMLLWCEISVGTFQDAVDGGSLDLYRVVSIDNGSTFETSPATGGVGNGHTYVGGCNVPASGTTAHVCIVGPFSIPPGQYKLLLDNQSGGQLTASGNTVQCGATNPELQ